MAEPGARALSVTALAGLISLALAAAAWPVLRQTPPKHP